MDMKQVYIDKIKNRIQDLSIEDLRRLYDILTSMLLEH